MKKITVKVSSSYEIMIQKDILPHAGEHISGLFGKNRKVCIVTDDNVFPLYGEILEKSLKESGFTVITYVIKNGESSKSFSVLSDLLEFLARNSLTRTDFLAALGGGVVGDLAGFAAAVYLRGIKFVQIPTTLLAAVDSSVGGKTGVDLAAGKNLAGAFHQPSLVLCDPKTLDTLSPAVLADGYAEVIKYGMICDAPLFEMLKYDVSDKMEEVIFACVKDKAAIVEEDEFDTGKRQLLNFGHTAGHGAEALSNFEISHGNAVAMGMALVTRAAYKSGYCEKEVLTSLLFLLKAYNLPESCPYSARELADAALRDKKRTGDFITLVLPESVGKCFLKKIPVGELEEFFRKGTDK